MHKQINVTVSRRTAKADSRMPYICGNTDYIVKFDFDAEWDEHSAKTARFVSEGKPVDVVFTGNECPMPTFVDTYTIYVGVYAGNLRTTTPALIISTKSILCGSGMPAEPTPDVYAQIMEIMNDVYTDTHASELAAKEAENNAVSACAAAETSAIEAKKQADLAYTYSAVANNAKGSVQLMKSLIDETAVKVESNSNAAKIAADTAIEAGTAAQAHATNAEQSAAMAAQSSDVAQSVADELITAIASVYTLEAANAEEIPKEADLDTYTTPGNYIVASDTIAETIKNIPVKLSGRITVQTTTQSSYVVHIYETDASKKSVYIRTKTRGVWNEWYKLAYSDEVNVLSEKAVMASNITITKSNYAKYFTDYNDIPVNSVYHINYDVPLLNSPPGNTTLNQADSTLEYMNGTVMTVSGFGDSEAVKNRLQIFSSASKLVPQAVLCFRSAYTNDGALYWTPWQKLSEVSALTAANIVIRKDTASQFFTNLNDAPINSIYQLDLDCDEETLANHPNPGQSCVLVTLGFSHVSRHGMVQMCWGLGGDTKMFYRYGYIQSEEEYRWTDWKRVATTTDVEAVEQKTDILAESIESVNKQIDAITAMSAQPIISETTGENVTITDAAARPIISLVVNTEPIQEGEGEPSTVNIRPIVKQNTVSATNETTGATITATVPENAYGCGVDIVKGVAAANEICMVFDGTENWQQMKSIKYPYYYLSIYDTQRLKARKGMCSHYPIVTITSDNSTIGYHPANSSAGDTKIIIRPDNTVITTLVEWKNYLAQQYAAGSPVTVVYVLSEPDYINIEPQQMYMVNGTNTISSVGGEMKIEYIADTKTYIDNKFNELQNAIVSLGSNV